LRSGNDYHLLVGRRRRLPWEAVSEIQEHPPPTHRNVDGRPPDGCRWRSRSGHHQHKKRRRRVPWEVPELVIQERPPSMHRNVDGGPPDGC
jgi:hypothetical protein